MNYSLNNIPDYGPDTVVWMDISINEEVIGRIHIKLFPEVFPAGVENFIRIVTGETYRAEHKGTGDNKFIREVRRTYEGCKFFNVLYGNYIVSGDIYNNDGSRAGTIYEDNPIPQMFGDYFYQHNLKGLISLVPFQDKDTGELFFDSTFMITLDRPTRTNTIEDLNTDQIVIGQITQGLEILDKINTLVFPYAGRRYPDIRIHKCGTNKNNLPPRLFSKNRRRIVY